MKDKNEIMLQDIANIVKSYSKHLSDDTLLENLLAAYSGYITTTFVKQDLAKEDMLNKLEEYFNIFRTTMNNVRINFEHI